MDDKNYEAPAPKSSAAKQNFLKIFISAGVCSMALISCFVFGTVFGGVIGAGKELVEENSSKNKLFVDAVSPSADSRSENYINLSAKTVEVIKNTKPSVVCIATTSTQTGFFNIQYEASSSGSGVIFHKTKNNIYIITNNHVIDGASSINVSVDGENFVEASLMGKDSKKDLAVIKVSMSALDEAGTNTDNITAAVFGDSDKVEAGSQVIAIGNALGEGITATSGVVSDVNREINVDGSILNVLQTDAAVNPGNSGGALINSKGEVIGINTAKNSETAVEGIGYSIISNDVKKAAEKIMRGEKSPYIGIYMSDISDEFAQYYNIESIGVMITQIIPGTSAANSDLRENDVITGFNGKPIFNKEQIIEALSECSVGDTIDVKIIRNGKTNMTIKLKLMAEPDQ